MYRAPAIKVHWCSCFRSVSTEAHKRRKISPLFTASAKICWFNFLLQLLLSVSPTFGMGQRPGSHWVASGCRMFFVLSCFLPKMWLQQNTNLTSSLIHFYSVQQEDSGTTLTDEIRHAHRRTSVHHHQNAQWNWQTACVGCLEPSHISCYDTGLSIYIW